MIDDPAALSEKEKDTLRLIVRGHDAKSAARQLGLSVHTINERLREARRKLGVSSSREAARRLFEREAAATESSGDKHFGEAVGASVTEDDGRPDDGLRWRLGSARTVAGVAVVSLALAFLALATSLPPAGTAHSSGETAASSAPAPRAAEVEQAARNFLSLLDQERWGESFDATTESFKRLNTNAAWTKASEAARVPLGAVRSRTLIARDSVPGPPAGIEVVKFRSDFANRAGAVETVSLAREDGQWRIVGIYIE